MSPARIIIVASDPRDLPELGGSVVHADDYLARRTSYRPGTTVVNLCRSYRYRSKGYYVSLVADARSHRVLPAIETLEELSEPFGIFRVLHEAGVPTLSVSEMNARRPGQLNVDAFAETIVVFGETLDERFAAAARAAYRAWPIPALRLTFALRGDEWFVAGAEPVPSRRLGPQERSRLVSALRSERSAVVGRPPPRTLTKRASIAVLYDQADPFRASTPETIEHFARVAAEQNIYADTIGLDEIDRLAEFDALFIRSLTGVREPSFPFALRAEMLDMPVVDDPQSIIRCGNKVFLEELLRREGIPTPRTIIVSPHSRWEEVSALGIPLVVKLPDGSFSAAVHRVGSPAEYARVTADMFRRSPLLIAQEYLWTEFDWRVAVLDGQVLFTARYFMAEGHWQIRKEDAQGDRYGRVEAVPRARAPREIVELARRAAALTGRGLYGVDLKEGPAGPVVIEVNDNPNLDRGEEDAGDGDVVYRDLLDYFVRRIEERSVPRPRPPRPVRRHHRPFSVAGIELEYAVVDSALEPVPGVEPAFRRLAGRYVSDFALGPVTFSNEIADHVFEIKTTDPVRSLTRAEEMLVEGVQRFAQLLNDNFAARLLPTAMHPWADPARARLWRRSGRRIYQAYAGIFDVQTHGWMNVHAAHLNLPMGRGHEAVAMHNAAVTILPYLPALAASSPIFDGVVHGAVDNRLEWIYRHQAAVPETQGEILPEFVESLTDYRARVLQPMYDAIGRLPGGAVLKHDFLNARGAVFKFSRRALEIRVIDMQECVKMDIAIAVFVRSLLRGYTRAILDGRFTLPPHRLLLADFRAAIRDGSRARVLAPHLGDSVERDDQGLAPVRAVLRALLDRAASTTRADEAEYLPLLASMIGSGTLSERIAAVVRPLEGDADAARARIAEVYAELAVCLVRNEPWRGRDLEGAAAGMNSSAGRSDPG